MTSDRIIFLFGSMSIYKLPEQVKEKLTLLLEGNPQIIVGDAPGIDSAFQRELLTKNYDDVEIYHSGDYYRNNIGGWPSKSIGTSHKGRKFYQAKDLAMRIMCNQGFAVWDGKSQGSLDNITGIQAVGNECIVFDTSLNTFVRYVPTGDILTLAGLK